jgi:predicted ThiF/HesA family dinucleotide-utilizing enzyme
MRPDIYVVDRYLGDRGKPLVVNLWGGDFKRNASSTLSAIWVTLPELPVLPPWQAPPTWGELREALRLQNIELDQLLEELFLGQALEKHSLMLLGFPIPRVWEGEYDRYHWQALQIPVLHPATKPVPGFRPDRRRAWQHNRKQVLKDDAGIAWIQSQNWAADELGSRGLLAPEFASMRICLVGAGAVGSVVAELLVRAGCHRITIFDHDRLNAGNLVRHSLRLGDTLEFKAEALARHLNSVSPHAKIDYVNSSFPPSDTKGLARLTKADVVIDCTGADDTIQEMGTFDWAGRKCFASLSIGARAKRLFVFGVRSGNFPVSDFRARVDPWLRREMEELEDSPEIPREGIGCWHPVFHARADDIWLLASVAVKALVPFLERDIREVLFKVYEQVEDGGTFSGVAIR